MLPATHVAPGAVDADSLPVVGVLDVGRYPEGVDDVIGGVAADLSASGFRSEPDPSVMRWKYEKLLTNLATALRALCGPEADDDAESAAARARLVAAVRDEALACYDAAGIVLPTPDEQARRWGGALTLRPIPGRPRAAGSAWQSLARGTGNIETDYINGEIVLLGRIQGVDTPVNAVVQRLANDAARRRLPPGSLPPAEVATGCRHPLNAVPLPTAVPAVRQVGKSSAAARASISAASSGSTTWSSTRRSTAASYFWYQVEWSG